MGGNGMRRSGTTGSCSLSDNSLAYRMMLRFRPIAPKPVDGQAVPTDMLPEKTNGRNGRVKRKYARIRKNRQYNSNRKRSNRILAVEQSILTNEQGSSSSGDKSLVTLQLLPIKRKDDKEELKNDETWCNIAENSRNPDRRHLCQWKEKEDNQSIIDFVEYKKVVMQRTIRIETWVTVEKVTSTCMDEGVGLGFSDVDKMNNIRLDTSPGFASDFSGKVQWVNEAYKKLVSQEDKEHQPTEFGVQLVVKEELPYSYPCFACTVRLEFALGWRKCSRIVPCDVWRMDFGGFAWKLDIKASLSLGLQPYSEN